MKLNKHCWVTGGTKHSKDHFSLVIDIVLKTMPRGLLPRLSCICWLTESDWGIQSYTICFVFDTSESLRPKKKKRKDTGGSGAGTNSVAIVQVNHKAGQLLSAGKGFLLSIYRVVPCITNTVSWTTNTSPLQEMFLVTPWCVPSYYSHNWRKVRTNPTCHKYTNQVARGIISQNIWPWITGTHHLPSDTS